MSTTYTAPGKPITWSTPQGGYPLVDNNFAQIGVIDIRNANGIAGSGEGYLRHKLMFFPNPNQGDEGNPVAQAKIWLIGYCMGVSHFMGFFRMSSPYDKYVFNFIESLDAIEIRGAGMITPEVTVVVNARYVGLPL